MKTSSRVNAKAFCVSQAIVLLLSNSVAAFADSGKQQSLLLPPLAPKLDLSGAADGPKSAPASYQAYNESDEAPPVADPAKEMLKKAMQLYAAGDMTLAENAFRKVIAIDSKNADAYYNLGVIQESRGDLEAALDSYKSASRINPSDNDLRSAVAGVQSKLNDKMAQEQQARQQQVQAAKEEQDRQMRDSLKQQVADAAQAYKSGNYDKAISNLQSVAGKAPDDADVQFALAQAYRGKGNFQSARQALNKALSIDPNNSNYKASLSDVNREIASGAQPRKAPSIAPTNSYQDGIPYQDSAPAGQLTGFSSGNRGGDQQTAYADDSAPAGQLTPFADSQNSQAQRGFASDYVRYNGTSTRLKRAAIGGLTGAAMGMAFSGFGGGRHSLMKGALVGGGLGLLLGGLSGF
jgi:tetratricopeptide (TPR) repeat protein